MAYKYFLYSEIQINEKNEWLDIERPLKEGEFYRIIRKI